MGRPVRYDGKARSEPGAILKRWQKEGRVVTTCPELVAGFETPRPAAEIAKGSDGFDVLDGRARVVESGGRDVTDLFVDGAKVTLDLAKRSDCRFALLTDGSPSCGSKTLYSGMFDGRTHSGQGVVTALLLKNGIKVFSEAHIAELDALLT